MTTDAVFYIVGELNKMAHSLGKDASCVESIFRHNGTVLNEEDMDFLRQVADEFYRMNELMSHLVKGVEEER